MRGTLIFLHLAKGRFRGPGCDPAAILFERDAVLAIKVVPDPPNGSRTIPARRLQSLMASLTKSTGLTVGWSSSSSRRPARNNRPDLANKSRVRAVARTPESPEM